MEYQVLKPGDPAYPKRLAERLGPEAPTLFHHGPLRLLERFTLAVAASDLIPAQATLASHQLLFTIREYGLNYIGGWHSVMETEIFRIALDLKNDPRRIRSLTLLSARGLEHEGWEEFLADRFGDKGPFTGFPEKDEYLRRGREGKLLILSLTEPTMRKMTRANIMARNLAACALADVVFIPFAEKGTKTYALCKRILAVGVPAFATECAENRDLVDLGIPVFNRNTVGVFLERLGASTKADPPFPASAEPQVVTLSGPICQKGKAQGPRQMPLLGKDG